LEFERFIANKCSFMRNMIPVYLFCVVFIIALPLVGKAETDSIPLEKFLAGKKIQAEKDQHNIFYTIEKQGSGVQPKKGDYVMLHYVGRLLNGTVFDRSLPKEPFVFQLGYGQVMPGWDLGLPRFRVGTKGTIYVPSDLAFGQAAIGEVPAEADLIFDIELLEILSQEAYDKYMSDLEAKERQAYEAQLAAQFIQDKKTINDYAVTNKLKVKRTDSGLSYVVTKKGKGLTAQPGNTVKVHFEGFLTDGTKFYSSIDRNEPFEFTLGSGKVIAGWEEGLLFFNKGSQGWLLIPSKLGYGAAPFDIGELTIPSNSILIFNIKVLEVL
jgi:FKBP-type peptidyl-prolyl cis-trans isomerase